MPPSTARTSSHPVTRYELDTPQPYDALRERFEAATPEFDGRRLAEFVRRGAPWDDVVRDAAASAPLGFFRFWKLDATASMALAGNAAACTEYLLGNNTIAERMFRVDPLAMLYVPLRVLVYAERADVTTFAIERPSSALASLGRPEIDAVGRELDAKLATLLAELGIAAPAELGAR